MGNKRKTLIFGNGLGMAVDSGTFSLCNAMKNVWDASPKVTDLTEEAKDLIRGCLPSTANQPSNEDDLDNLQVALQACDTLINLPTDDKMTSHWLSADGQKFPDAVRKFIHCTAGEFHGRDTLPPEFSESLVNFIKETKSHVATLNYDDLLYGQFLDEKILRGYRGTLVDGFWNDGFEADHLKRYCPPKLGYYLHLHGSPLFYTDEGNVLKKMKRNELKTPWTTAPRCNSHIVLTHIAHKPAIILGSELLRTYWKFLLRALDESVEVILFGCSGKDTHLNDILRRQCKKTPIRIIEWDGAGDQDKRKAYWEKCLKGCKSTTVVQLASILDFRDWHATT